MTIIQDKEVGKLWRQCIGHPDSQPGNVFVLKQLICKLVGEGILHDLDTRPNEAWITRNQALVKQLDRYGIDPATWPKE